MCIPFKFHETYVFSIGFSTVTNSVKLNGKNISSLEMSWLMELCSCAVKSSGSFLSFLVCEDYRLLDRHVGLVM